MGHDINFDKSTFLNLTIFNQKLYLKKFGKVNIIKTPIGFELMTYRFAVNALTYFATLICTLFSNFGKEKTLKV